MWFCTKCVCECNSAYKIDKCLDIENCSWEKFLFSKLVLACEDEIKTSHDDKKVTCEKNSCLIRTILSIIIWLFLLIVISVSFYYYYANH